MALYGWWSATAASKHGYSIYKTPEGVRINVTHVTHDPRCHGTFWDDIRFKGEVTDHCGNVKAPIPKQYAERDAELTFQVLKSRTPDLKAPCPLAYNGVGNCTCGRCPKPKAFNRNPFRY